MSDMQLFDNGEFELRIQPVGDSFKVEAPGLARSLGIRDAYRLTESIPDEEKGYTTACTPGGDQQVWFVTEAGFYRALGQRQTARIKNEATRSQVARFQSWVYREVLPSIRKTGSYTVPSQPQQFQIPRDFAEALELAAQQARAIDAANKRMAELEPRAAQADLHRAADGLMAVGDFANKLKAWAKDEHGVRVLHEEVWDFLGEIGLLIRGNTIRKNQRTAFAAEKDFVRMKETEYPTASHGMKTSSSPRLTPAGEGWAWDRAVRRIADNGTLRRLRMIRGAS
ncbi:phage antirepressor KilAC domain-containing protein [Nonomuraea sp. NPDC003560]|uniref:phage antirepressor KilAC domain-containing protein n=1 Tax=Nonomuraea sp. NPDC003560 TaxID=3364341 RepID=UPI0036A449CC